MVRRRRLAEQEGGEQRRRVGVLVVEAEAEEILAAFLTVEERAVRQRVLDAERMERRAVEDAAAAEAEVREDVRVGVDDAVERAVLELAAFDAARRVEAGLGRRGAAIARQQEQRVGGASVVDETTCGEKAPGLPMAQANLEEAGGLGVPLGIRLEAVVDEQDVREQLRLPAERLAVGDQIEPSVSCSR